MAIKTVYVCVVLIPVS